MSKSIYAIVNGTGMSSSPSYYSGYAANTGDLRSDRLRKIHEEIKQHYGQEAAQGFVDMMKHISNLSPTYFLNELYRLAANDFKYQKPAHEVPDSQKNVEVSDFGSAFGTVMMKMGPPQYDATEEIRADFLWAFGESCEMPTRMRIEHEMRMHRNRYIAQQYGFPEDDD
jgi:hypothetical protein